MSKLDRVIASRVLTAVIDGQRQDVQINLGQPYQDHDAVTCAYEIVVGNASTVHEVVGIDGIQALVLAIFMVGFFLRAMSVGCDCLWMVTRVSCNLAELFLLLCELPAMETMR